jgi:hypothetical protein
MAAAMVKAADALWDAWGGHDPTVAAASTQRSRSPTPSSGKRGEKRSGNARPKSCPLPAQIFIHSKTQAMAFANFTIITPIGLTGAFHPVLGRKTILPQKYILLKYEHISQKYIPQKHILHRYIPKNQFPQRHIPPKQISRKYSMYLS